MQNFDPIALSRTLSLCAAEARDWQLRLKTEPQHEDDPLATCRAELSVSGYLEVSESLSETDPMRDALLRWMRPLLEQRVNHWWYTHTAILRYSEQYTLEEPTRSLQRINGVIRQLLTDSRRPLFARALDQVSLQLSEATSVLWQRKVEVAHKLKLEASDLISSGLPDVLPLCERILSETDDLAESLRSADRGAWLEHIVTPLSGAEFPSKLNERNLAHWFRESRVLEAVPLRRWPLPDALCAPSFLRALYELGYEFHGALASPIQPFVISYEPSALDQHATGWCFTSALATRPFLERNLNVARTAMRDVQRRIAGILLYEVRLRAAGVLLAHAAYQGRRSLVEAHMELGDRLFGAPFGAATAGVLPRLREDAGARLVGMCLGQKYATDLRDAHNEDWYRNPRAIEQLRADAARPPTGVADASAVESGFAELKAQLQRFLS